MVFKYIITVNRFVFNIQMQFSSQVIANGLPHPAFNIPMQLLIIYLLFYKTHLHSFSFTCKSYRIKARVQFANIKHYAVCAFMHQAVFI